MHRRKCLALNVAIDTIREEASWGGRAAQVHNGKNLSRGAGKGNVVSTCWHQGLSLYAILHPTHIHNMSTCAGQFHMNGCLDQAQL